MQLPSLASSALLLKASIAGILTITISSVFVVCNTNQLTFFHSPHQSVCIRNPLQPSVSNFQKSVFRAREVRALIPARFAHDVFRAAGKAHVSPVLVAAVMHVETGSIHHPSHVVSSAGAIGPMQLMPSTAWGTLRINPWVPSSNILGGAEYISTLLHIFHGHIHQALAAYNVGPNNVLHWGINNAGAYYASRVLHYMQRSASLASQSGNKI